jgi:hypothetical protein
VVVVGVGVCVVAVVVVLMAGTEELDGLLGFGRVVGWWGGVGEGEGEHDEPGESDLCDIRLRVKDGGCRSLVRWL